MITSKNSKFKVCKIRVQRGGVPKRTAHGNRPIFLTKFRNVVHIFANLGNKNTGGHGNSYFDRYLTGILKWLERTSEIIPPGKAPWIPSKPVYSNISQDRHQKDSSLKHFHMHRCRQSKRKCCLKLFLILALLISLLSWASFAEFPGLWFLDRTI